MRALTWAATWEIWSQTFTKNWMQDYMTSTSELPNTKASATPAMTESSETVNSTVAEPKEVVSISTESEAPEAVSYTHLRAHET